MLTLPKRCFLSRRGAVDHKRVPSSILDPSIAAEKLVQKVIHFLCCRIVVFAKIVVQSAMVAVAFAVRLRLNAGPLQDLLQSFGLRSSFGVAREIENQEWWNTFAFGHMRHGREVDMFLRIIPEFLAMPESEHLATVNRLAKFGGHNNFRNVIGVAVNGDTTLQHIERTSFTL